MSLFGAALIFFACTAFGVLKANSLTALDRSYTELLCALEIIKGEIISRHTALDKALQNAACASRGAAASFLKSVSFAELGERSFAELWKTSAELNLGGVSLRALSAITALGGSLGKYDAESQAAAIDQCCAEISSERERLRADLEANRRMYAGIGAAAGLITVIVLL